MGAVLWGRPGGAGLNVSKRAGQIASDAKMDAQPQHGDIDHDGSDAPDSDQNALGLQKIASCIGRNVSLRAPE